MVPNINDNKKTVNFNNRLPECEAMLILSVIKMFLKHVLGKCQLYFPYTSTRIHLYHKYQTQRQKVYNIILFIYL